MKYFLSVFFLIVSLNYIADARVNGYGYGYSDEVVGQWQKADNQNINQLSFFGDSTFSEVINNKKITGTFSIKIEKTKTLEMKDTEKFKNKLFFNFIINDASFTKINSTNLELSLLGTMRNKLTNNIKKVELVYSLPISSSSKDKILPPLKEGKWLLWKTHLWPVGLITFFSKPYTFKYEEGRYEIKNNNNIYQTGGKYKLQFSKYKVIKLNYKNKSSKTFRYKIEHKLVKNRYYKQLHLTSPGIDEIYSLQNEIP